jgi:hypothetical protein
MSQMNAPTVDATIPAARPVMPTYSGPGKPVAQGEAIPSKQLPQDERKAKLADYDAKIQAALDTATPEGKELADRLSYAKQAYKYHTPWGSAENHPGILGKLGHAAAAVGNTAGNIVAPKIMAAIPGTEANRSEQAQSTLGRINTETPLTTARMGEESKEPPKPGTPAEQVYKAHIAAGETPDQALIASEAKPAAATVKEQVPENRLADAKVAIANSQAALAKNPNDPEAKAALDKAMVEEKAMTDSIAANKTTAATAPATAEQVTEYGNRIKQLGLTPEQDKVYGNAPAGTTTAELDKRYTEAQGLKTASDKEAETKVTNQARDDAAAAKKTEEAGKVFDKYNTQLDKIKTPADATAARANLAIHNLDLKTKQADSLVAPEILTLAAGGQGSGLRMNEAEISRIVGGRSIWDALVSHANKVVQENGTFDDNQRGQLRKIASYIAERSAATSSVLDVARNNMLAGQGDEAAVRKAYSDGNRVASAINRQGIVPEGGVRSPGDYVMYNGQVMIVDAKGKGHPALE